jgi:hypothetical protein
MITRGRRTDVTERTNPERTEGAMKMPMRTFTDEGNARSWMLLLNRSRRGRTELSVMVDGPNDEEFTVMDLRDAIEGEFAYSWEV